MNVLTYSYENGEKHTYVFDNVDDLITKFNLIVHECFEKQIKLKFKITLK